MGNSENQIKPITIRQLAVAGLFIIIISSVFIGFIIKHKAQSELQIYSGEIPPVIKAKKISQASAPNLQTMSFTINPNH